MNYACVFTVCLHNSIVERITCIKKYNKVYELGNQTRIDKIALLPQPTIYGFSKYIVHVIFTLHPSLIKNRSSILDQWDFCMRK